MPPKRTLLLIVLIFITFVNLRAQESGTAFNFLSISTSAHSTALGGQNISTIEDDASMIFQNPTSLANVSSKTINFNYMNYMRGCNSGSASYVQAQGEHGSWGVGVQFLGYGNMMETDWEGHQLGTMNALDLNITGGYSYMLTDNLVGAVTGKLLYSNYARYSSVGLCVDLGLNYYMEESDFSISAVATNLGGQVKAFNNERNGLPFDLKVGFSKGIGHLPARITVTISDITHWSKDYYLQSSGDEISGFSLLMNHFSFGLDVFPTKFMWLALGYNFRRGYEMNVAGSSHAAGLSLGAGIDIKRFKVGFAYARQHLSTNCFVVNLAYTL